MAKTSNRRGAASRTARAASSRPARQPKKRRARETKVGPHEPLRITYWCEKLDISHETLAELTGYSVEYISQMANGRRRFNQSILDAFAHGFNVSRAALLPLKPDDPMFVFGSMDREQQQRTLNIAEAAVEQAAKR